METTREDKIDLLLRVAQDVDVDSRKRPAVDTTIHEIKKKGLSQYTPSAVDMKTELEQALKARDDARNELTKLLAGTYEAYAGHAKRVHTMQQQRTDDVKKIEALEKKVAELQHHKQQLDVPAAGADQAEVRRAGLLPEVDCRAALAVWH